jgi:hypothetical protein
LALIKLKWPHEFERHLKKTRAAPFVILPSSIQLIPSACAGAAAGIKKTSGQVVD